MSVSHDKAMTVSKRISFILVVFASSFVLPVLAVNMVAISSNAYANQRITNVSVVQTAPAFTQLRLGFSGTPVLPTTYQLNDPSRLVLDFEKVQNSLISRYTNYNIGMIKDIANLNNDSITRLIIGLKQEGDYTTAVIGNDLLLTITDSKRPLITMASDDVLLTDSSPITNTKMITPIVDSSSVTVAPIFSRSAFIKNQAPADMTTVRINPLLDPKLAASQVSKQYNYNGLSALDFAASSLGGGNINIALANEAIPVDVQRQGNKLVIRLTGSTVPRNLLRHLNINSGLVDSIDTKNQNRNGVVTINMNADYEYQAYQSGNQLNISISKPKLLREEAVKAKVYSGKALSMEFQDIEIRSVLDILAQFTDMNIVASDSVTGNITLRLINVPWDQALDIILKSKNLGRREIGNVILIAPSTELAQQEAQALEVQ